VTYLLKARSVEPQKRSLLANGPETTFVSSQRLGKHVPASSDTHATVEVLLEQRFREDFRAEAEESPLLEAVTRERLVKTQQAGESLACVVVICELWRLAVAL
jgi:hypothetical protein